MYRAVKLYIQQNQMGIKNEQAVSSAVENVHVGFILTPKKTKILLNGTDVSDAIRTMEVSEYVSEVSAVKAVRKAMVKQQQDLGMKRNIVMDGRDIGTTVFRNADLKIFMTASPQVRAER